LASAAKTDRTSVLRDCHIYQDTVTFFYVLFETLSKAGVVVEIEQDIPVPAGGHRTPDFAVIDSGRLADVLDHKGSLPEAARTLIELTKMRARYRTFQHNGQNVSPQVTVLYPASKQAIIEDVRTQLPNDLTLCSFDQMTRDTEIKFRLQGPVKAQGLAQVLGTNPIEYRPSYVRSTYKFIKAEAPVVYTAFSVWWLFPSFRDTKTAYQRDYTVERDVLLSRLGKFYPPWIRNNLQLSSSRVNKALEFLSTIKFIDWAPGRNDIIVHSEKGSRSGDLLEYLAERWAKAGPRRPPKGTASIPEDQAVLDDFGIRSTGPRTNR